MKNEIEKLKKENHLLWRALLRAKDVIHAMPQDVDIPDESQQLLDGCVGDFEQAMKSLREYSKAEKS